MSTPPEIQVNNLSVNDSQPVQNGDKPREVLNKLEEKTTPVAGVTSTTLPPGGPAIATGTAYPVAALADEKSKNAGALLDVCIYFFFVKKTCLCLSH